MGADREQRVEGYRETSLKADELDSKGRRSATLALLTDAHAAAAEAGDEDYRLFLEAELAHYNGPDPPRSIELMAAALAWADDRGLARDHFLLGAMGAHHQFMEDHGAAIEWFDRALAADPDDHVAMLCRGFSLSKKGDEEAAVEWYDKALALSPNDHDALVSKGVSLTKLGRREAAMEWFGKALSAKPDDHATMRKIGILLSEMGEHDEAIEWFDRALAVEPDDYFTMFSRGIALSNKGDQDAATEWFDKAQAVKPDDADARQ